MTRVYQYACRPPTREADRVRDQLRLAHAYRERLAAIERARRATVTAAQREAEPDLAPAETALHVAQDALRLALQNLPPRKSPSRPDGLMACRAARIAVREGRGAVRTLRLRAAAALEASGSLLVAHATARQAQRDARAACGLYWGTYLLIERAHDLARRAPGDVVVPPWRGGGQVAVQLQQGMPVAALLGAHDRRAVLSATRVAAPQKSQEAVCQTATEMLERLGTRTDAEAVRRRAQLTARLARYRDPAWVRPVARLSTLAIRVGSDGRAPIWASWPVVYDRPLPPDARITWIAVQCQRRVDGREDWTAAITVDLPDPIPTADPDRAVAVDLGWRRRDDGSLRAGGISSTDMPAGTITDLVLDPSVEARLRRASELQSLRDQYLATLRETIRGWVDRMECLPPAHAAQLATVAHWRSASRVVRLWRWWQTARVEGDESLLASLAAWYARDRHLWLYQIGLSRRALLARREQARRLAATLAARYGTLVIERIDLARIARIPGDDQRTEHPQGIGPRHGRAQRVVVAPHVWRQAMVNAFRRHGGVVATVPAGVDAAAHLTRWRERSSDVEIAGIARANRFTRLGQSAAIPGSVDVEEEGAARAPAAK